MIKAKTPPNWHMNKWKMRMTFECRYPVARDKETSALQRQHGYNSDWSYYHERMTTYQERHKHINTCIYLYNPYKHETNREAEVNTHTLICLHVYRYVISLSIWLSLTLSVYYTRISGRPRLSRLTHESRQTICRQALIWCQQLR